MGASGAALFPLKRACLPLGPRPASSARARTHHPTPVFRTPEQPCAVSLSFNVAPGLRAALHAHAHAHATPLPHTSAAALCSVPLSPEMALPVPGAKAAGRPQQPISLRCLAISRDGGHLAVGGCWAELRLPGPAQEGPCSAGRPPGVPFGMVYFKYLLNKLFGRLLLHNPVPLPGVPEPVPIPRCHPTDPGCTPTRVTHPACRRRGVQYPLLAHQHHPRTNPHPSCA